MVDLILYVEETQLKLLTFVGSKGKETKIMLFKEYLTTMHTYK